MILSCTCRLTGFIRAIPACQTDTAERTAQRLFSVWLSIFGAPRSMIGDRDKAWTSRFWQELNSLLHVDVKLTTAYHPQADGRSEISNKTIVQILRHLVENRHGKWFESLPAVEYAVNSAINVSTGVSPFEFVFGHKPRLFPIQGNIAKVSPDVQRWVELRQSAWAQYRDKLWSSRISQALHYNNRRRQGDTLKVDDWVLIDSKDRQQIVGGKGRPTSKLRPRFDGPYHVEECLNDGRNFRLRLNEDDRSHPIFHISKLKKYHWREDEREFGVQK